MPTLDRNRKYSEVYGDSLARYYQDGVYYDAQGGVVSWTDASRTVQPEDQSREEATRLAELQSRAIIESKMGESAAPNPQVQQVGWTKPKAATVEDVDRLIAEREKNLTPEQAATVEESLSQFRKTQSVRTDPPESTDVTPEFERLTKLPPVKLKAVVNRLKDSLDKSKLNQEQLEHIAEFPATGVGAQAKNAQFVLDFSAKE